MTTWDRDILQKMLDEHIGMRDWEQKRIDYAVSKNADPDLIAYLTSAKEMYEGWARDVQERLEQTP